MDRLRDFAERYTAAWNSHDPLRVAGFFAAEGKISVNGGAPAPIVEVARGFLTEIPDLKLFCDGVSAQGDTAIYHWTFEGTNSGPGGNGNRVRISGFERWRFGSDGLIAESQGDFDAAEYDRQLRSGVDQPR